MNYLSLDLGASTVDLVRWSDSKIKEILTFETDKIALDFKKLIEQKRNLLKKNTKVYLTGGRSLMISNVLKGIKFIKIPEITAIGAGGAFLYGKKENILVVSMGTGTCMVKVKRQTLPIGRQESKIESQHVGGTGVGGGTFLGLTKLILGEIDINNLIRMFSKGDRLKVDLTVKDIVGRRIGLVPESATASNLGRVSRKIWQGREVKFSKNDLAAGIANLIGQTIATAAIFAAKSEGLKTIVLGGKLTRIAKITEIIFEVGKIYGIKIVLPKNADYISAIGAGILL